MSAGGRVPGSGIDPEAYLRFVLKRMAEHRINALDELLPWAVATNLAGAEQRLAA